MSGTVILDVDGTLVDSNDAHASAWVDAFATHGITVPFDLVRRRIGMGGDKLMPEVSGISEDSDQGAAIAATRAELFTRDYLPRIAAFARVRELIERFLADGLRLAVASSAKEGELTPLLEAAGVEDLIKRRTSSDDADASKPEPDIVLAALQQAKAAPEQAVMLGDTPYDIEAATRAGVRVVAVESGGWRRDELTGAAEVYRDVADILERYDSTVFARMRSSHAKA